MCGDHSNDAYWRTVRWTIGCTRAETKEPLTLCTKAQEHERSDVSMLSITLHRVLHDIARRYDGFGHR